jgi:molybdate transport system substrate-binding protein
MLLTVLLTFRCSSAGRCAMVWCATQVRGRKLHATMREGTSVISLYRKLASVARTALTIGFAIALLSGAGAAEIKLMSSGGMKVALVDLIPVFEQATKHKVTATYAAPGVIKDRVSAGELVDVLVFPAAGVDDLIKQDKIVADSKVILARSGMGVAVRTGAPKPDISTPEALKRTLLAAKSIVYTDPALRSPSGIHFAKVLERFGIADEMKAKSKLHGGVGFNAEFVAKGEIELAIQQISEIVPVIGVELVGPLPADLQLMTVYATAIGTSAKEKAAAREFIKFLTSSAATAVIKATGMESGGS